MTEVLRHQRRLTDSRPAGAAATCESRPRFGAPNAITPAAIKTPTPAVPFPAGHRPAYGKSPATPTPNHSIFSSPRSLPGYSDDLAQKNLKDQKNRLQNMIRIPRIPQCLDDLSRTPARDAGPLPINL